MNLGRFHLALLGAEVLELRELVFLWGNQVPLQILVEGNLSLWIEERTAKDQPLQDGLDH